MSEEVVGFTPVNQISKIVEESYKDFATGITKNVEFRKQQLNQLRKFSKENKDLIRE